LTPIPPKPIYFNRIKIEMTTVARLLVVKADRLVASPRGIFFLWAYTLVGASMKVKLQEKREAMTLK
jgi:hypothetical protein